LVNDIQQIDVAACGNLLLNANRHCVFPETQHTRFALSLSRRERDRNRRNFLVS